MIPRIPLGRIGAIRSHCDLVSKRKQLEGSEKRLHVLSSNGGRARRSSNWEERGETSGAGGEAAQTREKKHDNAAFAWACDAQKQRLGEAGALTVVSGMAVLRGRELLSGADPKPGTGAVIPFPGSATRQPCMVTKYVILPVKSVVIRHVAWLAIVMRIHHMTASSLYTMYSVACCMIISYHILYAVCRCKVAPRLITELQAMWGISIIRSIYTDYYHRRERG
jgi:hypothetical protein